MHTHVESLPDGVAVIGVRGDVDAFSAAVLKEQFFAALDYGYIASSST